MDREAPLTPIRSPHHAVAIVQDSPYSDYFTDEARSVDYNDKTGYSMPSSETQRVLLRLNDLGAQILRHDPGSSAVRTLGARLDALEDELNNPDIQSRQSTEMIDSGLYMEEEDGLETPNGSALSVNVPAAPTAFALDGCTDIDLNARREDQIKIKNQKRLLKETQALLERVTKANTETRKRFEQMKQLNEKHANELVESTREVLNLRSENEGLKADLGFDHSELLFLKLQLKALEVQADGFLCDNKFQQEKRVLLQEDMERWKLDCDDIDARLRGRRQAHRVMSSSPSKFVGKRDGDRSVDQEGDWKLDLCKKRQGRVQSITIKRLSALGLDGVRDEEDTSLSHEAEFNGYSEQATQTDGAADDAEGGSLLVAETDPEIVQPLKTPWQELWASLAAFAGMEED